MNEKKTPAKKLPSKPINIDELRLSLMSDLETLAKEKKAKDPENILKSLSEEIKTMISMNLTVSEQLAILKKNGVTIKPAFYKTFIASLGNQSTPHN